MQQDGMTRNTGFRVWDSGAGHITPQVLAGFSKVKMMPTDTPEHIAAAQKAMEELLAKYPIKEIPRAYLGRDREKGSSLRLKDAEGHNRIILRVAADGTPEMQFLDASGKARSQWPAK